MADSYILTLNNQSTILAEMKTSTETIVSTFDAKTHLSRLLREVAGGKVVTITKRGKPVAVIVSYEEYVQSKRVGGYRKIIEARETFLKTGISSDEIFKASRKQLENKS